MNNSRLDESDGRIRCAACGSEIRDNAWFARIHDSDGLLTFCRPRCVEVFLEQKDPALRDYKQPVFVGSE